MADGQVDQGVVTLWVARHFFNRELGYYGYGGQGKQVRDMLHVADLFDLLCRQLERDRRMGRPASITSAAAPRFPRRWSN